MLSQFTEKALLFYALFTGLKCSHRAQGDLSGLNRPEPTRDVTGILNTHNAQGKNVVPSQNPDLEELKLPQSCSPLNA